MNVSIWNKAVGEISLAGFRFAGQCKCPSRIYKYRKGQYEIKMMRSSGSARMLENGHTIKTGTIENIQKFIERAEEKTSVLVRP